VCVSFAEAKERRSRREIDKISPHVKKGMPAETERGGQSW